jgi:gliding motility-associated-like protein
MGVVDIIVFQKRTALDENYIFARLRKRFLYMIQPLNVLTAACLCLVSFSTLAQVAEPLIIPESARTQRSVCAGLGMDAGSIFSIAALGAQSNDIDNDAIVLCFGDQILINHSGDADLRDDPDGSTRPGVGYAFYSCPPTIPGPELNDLTGDACLTDMPVPANGVWVARGNPEGDVVFHNNGSIQTQFFNGAAGMLYFAPITITNFDATPPAFDAGGNCLHVSTGEAFSVIYLNDIRLVNFSTPDNSSLSGMFSLSGGYPEYDPLVNYGVTLIKIDDPAVQGIIDASITHGGTTTFSVPEPGTYTLSVTDPKGCTKDFVVNVPNVDPVQLCLGDSAVIPETNFCMPVTVSNFNNVLSVALTIGWDPSVIEFIGVSNVNPTLGSSNIGFDENRKDEGILPVLFFEQNLMKISLPDSAILFEVCFTVIGPPGSRTSVEFLNNPTSISVTDDNMDLGVILKPGSVVVSNPSIPTLFYTACANASGNLIFTMRVFGGADPYTYEIISSSGNPYDSGTIPGGVITGYPDLPPDIYNIIITDGTGASVPKTLDLRSINPLQIDTTVTDPSCMGVNDGSIEINALMGGTAPYGIAWTGAGLTRYGTNLLDDLPAGNYNLLVRDVHGCSDTLDFVLQESTLQIREDSKTLPECLGMPTGEIAVSVIGGNAASYQFIWQNAAGQQIRNANTGSSDRLQNIPAGTYFIQVSDGFCDVRDTITLGVLKTMQLQVDSIRLPSCAGDSDAYIGISVSIPINKQGPVFAWSTDAQTVVTSNDTVSIATMVRPGNHSVTISDGACQVDTTFTITDPRPVDLNTQLLRQPPYLVQPDCPDGTNGKIDLGFADLVIGGTPLSGTPYHFRWYDLNNGNNTWLNPSRNFSQIRDLSAGFYGVYVEDANGCSDSTVFELVAGPNVVITLDQENICRGDSVAQLTVSGDLTGNTLMWSTGAATPTISNLKEGVYWVSVTETSASGTCTVVDTVQIIDPVVPVNVILPMQFSPRSLCNEPDSGIIFNLQIDYPGPKSYIWPTLNDTVTTIPFISVNNSGNYPFTVIDRTTGCIIYDSMVVATFPEKISIDIDSISVNCYGDNNGEIEVTAAGRSGLFNFTWESGFVNTNATSSMAQNLMAGIYRVTVTEATDTACSVPLTINIAQPDTLTLAVDSAFTQDVRCFGEGNGQIGLLWQGGNQDAAPGIVWSAGGVTNTLSATGLDAGTYDIVLTDSKGCTGMVSVTLSEPPQLFASVPVPDDPVCNGFQTLITVASASGGTGSNYTFSVDNGPTQMIGNEIPVYAGDHVVTVFDEHGCRLDTMLTITDPDAIDVDLGPDLSVALGDSIRLNALVNGPSTIDSYIWTPSDLLSCNNCDGPFARPFEDQLFELTVVDINGCEGQDQIRVSVDKARLIYIPNGFTPNGDGVNDRWQVYSGPGVRQILGTHVFDRWGNLVFESGQEPAPMGFGSNGWDGRTHTRLMNPGVYVYMVQVEFIDGRIFTYRGDVTMAH